ncbi:MAG: hypothetical protein ACXABY_23550 [Candidatus Thorarchaeota archaeon]|jgi:hypothetical protein
MKWHYLFEDEHTLSESKMRAIDALVRKALRKPEDATLLELHREMGYTRHAFKKWEQILRRYPANYAVRCFWLNTGKAHDIATYSANMYEECYTASDEPDEEPEKEVDTIWDNEKVSLDEFLYEAADKYVSSQGSHWWSSHPETMYGRDGNPECSHSMHIRYTIPLGTGMLAKYKMGYILEKDWERIDKAIQHRVTDAHNVHDLDPFRP